MKELIRIFIAITVVLLLGCFIGSTLDNLNKTSNSKNLYEQINIGDFYQIKCICHSSCSENHIIKITNKRVQKTTGRYMIDVHIEDENVTTTKYVDFTYDVDTFMQVFEPVKINN